MDLLYLLPWVLGTAMLSAVVGMAGGMVLLLVLVAYMPLAEAMVLHGGLQLVANGTRALISARFVRRDIVRRFALAALVTTASGVAIVLLVPAAGQLALDARYVLIATGLVACSEPLLAYLHRTRRALALPSADTVRGGYVAGAINTALHLTSGATGPLLDVFFVRSALDRHENVATKAAVQSLGHALKILYFTTLGMSAARFTPSAATASGAAASFAVLAIASVAGTWLGRRVLDRLSEADFRRATRGLIVAIGIVSLVRGAWL
jgi:uncharacterized membrane protein YfcA